MTRGDVPGRAGIAARWPLGLAVVSWRYLWRTTPLHRSEEPGSAADLPSGWERRADDGQQVLAGQIEFRAVPDGDALRFEIESWARAGDRLADVLHSVTKWR
jgi:hypothetical protein